MSRRNGSRGRAAMTLLTVCLALAVAGCGNGSGSGSEASSKPAAGAASPSAAASPAAAASSATGGGAITQQEAGIKVRVDMKEIANFMSAAKPGPIIPGLLQNAVPQGLAYVPEQRWLVISHYRDDGKPSFLSILDELSGKLVKTVMLYSEPNKPYVGHAGGVTYSGKHLWISSEGYLYQLKLDDVVKAKEGDKLVFSGKIKTEVRSSFSAYSDGILWAGEYAYGKDYPTSETHYMDNRDGKQHKAWVVGYKLDPQTDSLPAGKAGDGNTPVTPDYILSIQDAVQGMDISKDRVVLSSSNGRNNAATLVKYTNPLAEPAHAKAKIGSAEVPVWFLDGKSKKEELTAPPMTEGLAQTSGGLYVLFESGATTYRSNGAYPLDHLYLLGWK